MKVVLYAEGPGELVGEAGMGPPTPGARIDEDGLGAGHVLVRRSIVAVSNVPEQAVQFYGPLRGGSGHPLRGSDFLVKERLRQALTWLDPKRQPELAVVCVDADGKPDRLAELEGYVIDRPVRHVIALAEQEFEAWLLADIAAVNQALEQRQPMTKDPESFAPGEAKALLHSWLVQCDPAHPIGVRRREIAQRCDLGMVGKRCPSFQSFLDRLRKALQ